MIENLKLDEQEYDQWHAIVPAARFRQVGLLRDGCVAVIVIVLHQSEYGRPRATTARLAKLATRIMANNKAIEKVNNNLTLGAPPRLIHGLKLPSFGLDHSNVWPPRG
jgi:hypothetical protein